MEGTQFDFSYAPGTSQEQIIGFEMAGEIWSQYLTDNVTVNIHVEITNKLPENVIGGALPGTKKGVKYDKLWEEMSSDITTWNDLTAFNNLASEKEILALVNGKRGNVKEMKLTNANSKALDLIDGDQDKLDGYILMSDLSGQGNVQWDYDSLRGGSIGNSKLDFLSVAIHEVGHILGFTSGLDDGEWLNVVTKAQNEGKEVKSDEMKFATPLDLFRYSGNGQLNLSMGQNSYFSINGGRTKLANFSTGEQTKMGGDGYQASHWKHNGKDVLGIMDPVLKLGVRREVSALDTLAMDVIGWNVSNPGQLDWRNMYADAVGDASHAWIENRDKDVEKMIKDSNNYNGRRDRSSSSGGSWQVGFWQNIKFQTIDFSDMSVEVQPPAALSVEYVLIDNSVDNVQTQIFVDRSSENVKLDNESIEVISSEAVTLQIDSQDPVIETANLDLSQIAQLLKQNMEDLGSFNDYLVMPIA